jgi:hypothetical protein
MITIETRRVQELFAARLHPHVRAETEIATVIADQLQPPDPVTAAQPLQPPQAKPAMDTNHERKEAGKNSIRTLMSIKVSLCSQPTM